MRIFIRQKQINNKDVFINSYNDCEKWIIISNKTLVENLYKKIAEFILDSKDFSFVCRIIKFIKKKSKKSKNNLINFLIESKIIIEDLKPSMIDKKIFGKEYFCNNPKWIRYFKSKDFDQYYRCCKKHNISIMVFDK